FDSFDGDSIIDIARLNADGSLDSSFDPGLSSNGIIYDVVVLQSGKILVAGQFSSFNSISANNIVLLNQDGSVDTAFDVATGPNESVKALLEQPDGKIVIGGNFTTFNAQSRQYLARIESDGSLDTSFIVGSSIEFPVYSLALQSTNNIIFVGLFYNDSGVEDIQIGRLLADTGTLDSSFNPGGVATDPGYWSNTVSIEALKVLDTDQILIGGQFREYNLVTRNGIARLQADGTLDTVFDPGTGVDYAVKSISLLSNNQIIIAGNYYTYNDSASVSISKLEGDPLVEQGSDEEIEVSSGNNSSSGFTSSISNVNTPSCSDSTPVGVPDLFQVDVASDRAILYFSPVNTPAPNYLVSYSQYDNAFQHSVFTNQGYSSGALVFTIDELQPNTTYFMKVRGQNGCAPGHWGNQVKITTAKKGVAYYRPVYAFSPIRLF
ncbi:hypothetical protein KC909_06265, partial [Candidatus Dojkabacteria bacterium]|nr:hypothetical protein [Candidatus Dojkabacteria bacterium]